MVPWYGQRWSRVVVVVEVEPRWARLMVVVVVEPGGGGGGGGGGKRNQIKAKATLSLAYPIAPSLAGASYEGQPL